MDQIAGATTAAAPRQPLASFSNTYSPVDDSSKQEQSCADVPIIPVTPAVSRVPIRAPSATPSVARAAAPASLFTPQVPRSSSAVQASAAKPAAAPASAAKPKISRETKLRYNDLIGKARDAQAAKQLRIALSCYSEAYALVETAPLFNKLQNLKVSSVS